MILKRVHKERFTQIATSALEAKELSWSAKGVLGYIMSRPENWEIHIEHLATVSTDGKHSTRKAVQELITCGYVIRTQTRQGDGRFSKYEYWVSDVPYSIFPTAEEPQADLPKPEEPQAENQPLVIRKDRNKGNTNKKNKNKENTNKNDTHTQAESIFSISIPFEIAFSENKTYFNNICQDILAEIDANHYYTKITHYTRSKSIQKTQEEWEAYIKLWIEEDIAKNKVKLLKKSKAKVDKTPQNESHELVQNFSRRWKDYEQIASIESVLEKLRSIWQHLDEPHRELATQVAQNLNQRLQMQKST